MRYRDCTIKLNQNIMDASSYEGMMSRYKSFEILLIDDLFKGSITSSDLNVIFEIVNHRYFNNLLMIISSEKRRKELIKIDEAIGSRILEMCGDYSVELKRCKLNYSLYS